MGKVFKALSKSESEQPLPSLAALVIAEEEAAEAAQPHEPAEAPRRLHRPSFDAVRAHQQPAEAFDFMHFSLNAPATDAFDHEAHAAPTPRIKQTAPASNVVLDATRVDPHLVTFYDFDPRAAEEYNKTAITMISAAADQPLRRVLIASAQHGEGRRVVVGDVEHERRPLLRPELLVDVGCESLDARGVLPVGRQVLARRVVVNDVHDTFAPLRMRAQQFAVGQQAAQHVLRQLDAIDPRDQLPIADGVLQPVPVLGAGVALQYLSPRVTLLIFAAAVGLGILADAPSLLRRPGR